MLNNLKIRTKLILILISVSIFPFVMIGLIAINISNEAMLNKIFSQLESVRNSKKAQIERYFSKTKSDINVLANSAHIGAALDGFSSTLIEGKIDDSQYDYFSSLEYGEFFAKFCQEYGYDDMLLITLKGNIVYSLKKSTDLAKNVLLPPLNDTYLGGHFKKGLQSITMTDFRPYAPSNNRPIAFLFAPILIFGEVEGTVVLKLSIDSINNIMAERSGMGDTGEAYLVGPDKLMRSDSYLNLMTHSVTASFNNPEVGYVDTEASRAALNLEYGRKTTIDYRGIKVLSAYVPISLENATYALITEIDEAEAFQSINDLETLIIYAGITIFILAILISVFMANKFTKPLIWLTDSTQKIAEGHFEISLKFNREDEIGTLAKSFNKMQEGIKNTINKLDAEITEKNKAEAALQLANLELEDKVKIRTEELVGNQAQLLAVKEQIQSILNSAGEGIFGVDLNGTITFINEAGCAILGYEKEELLVQEIHNLIHHTRKDGSDYPIEECPMKRAYIEGKTFNIDNEILWKKDGTGIDVEYTSTPIIKEKEITGAVVTFRDVTESRKAAKELKASQGRFRAYFEHSQVGMAVTHPDKGWLEVNKRLTDIFGYQFDELKDTGWVKLTHPDDIEEDLQNYQDMMDGKFDSYTLEKRMLRKDGQVIYINLSVSCIRTPQGHVDKILASMLDITEAKTTEEELNQRLDELSRFRKMAIGRELKMIELKKTINDLLIKSGLASKYKIN